MQPAHDPLVTDELKLRHRRSVGEIGDDDLHKGLVLVASGYAARGDRVRAVQRLRWCHPSYYIEGVLGRQLRSDQDFLAAAAELARGLEEAQVGVRPIAFTSLPAPASA